MATEEIIRSIGQGVRDTAVHYYGGLQKLAATLHLNSSRINCIQMTL